MQHKNCKKAWYWSKNIYKQFGYFEWTKKKKWKFNLKIWKILWNETREKKIKIKFPEVKKKNMIHINRANFLLFFSFHSIWNFSNVEMRKRKMEKNNTNNTTTYRTLKQKKKLNLRRPKRLKRQYSTKQKTKFHINTFWRIRKQRQRSKWMKEKTIQPTSQPVKQWGCRIFFSFDII